MEYYRITQGNSPVLHIAFQKAVIGKAKQRIEDLDVTTMSELSVNLLAPTGYKISVPYEYANDATNEILVVIPADLALGSYGIEVLGTYKGNSIASRERRIFMIVPFNYHTTIPLGVLDGEMGGMLNTKYWIDFNNEEQIDYTINVTASPSSITYDEEAHDVTVAWQITDNSGNEVVPDELTITYNGETTTLETTDTSKVYSVQASGVHAFIVNAVIGEDSVNGIARVQVVANDVVSYYGVVPYEAREDMSVDYISANLETFINNGWLVQSGSLLKQLSPITLATTTERKCYVLASNKPFTVKVGGIDMTPDMPSGEADGVTFRWLVDGANRTTIFTLE